MPRKSPLPRKNSREEKARQTKAWSTPITFVVGAVLTAAQMNINVRDNLNVTEAAIVTTAGDLVYATGVNALARLGIGTAFQALQTNAGATAPAWSTPYAWKIQELTPTGTNVDFTSIAATPYKHLLLVGYHRCDAAVNIRNLNLQFNGDTAANYDWIKLGGVAQIGATLILVGDTPGANATANMFA